MAMRELLRKVTGATLIGAYVDLKCCEWKQMYKQFKIWIWLFFNGGREVKEKWKLQVWVSVEVFLYTEYRLWIKYNTQWNKRRGSCATQIPLHDCTQAAETRYTYLIPKRQPRISAPRRGCAVGIMTVNRPRHPCLSPESVQNKSWIKSKSS